MKKLLTAPERWQVVSSYPQDCRPERWTGSMQSLSARIALPLVVALVAGAAMPVHAKDKANIAVTTPSPPAPPTKDWCQKFCGEMAGDFCHQHYNYLNANPPGGLGCDDPLSKQQPCASFWKQHKFICWKWGWDNMEPCSPEWMKACWKSAATPKSKVGGKKVAPPPPKAQPGPKPGSAKTALKCAPNMTPNARGTCVPKLDMPGFDTSLGSTPGAGRAAPAGAGPPAGRR